jgi:hypothetical protein
MSVLRRRLVFVSFVCFVPLQRVTAPWSSVQATSIARHRWRSRAAISTTTTSRPFIAPRA